MILGIDPGKNGAFVGLNDQGKIAFILAMPTTKSEEVGYEINQEVIREKLPRPLIRRVYIEEARPFAMGAKGAMTMGYNLRMIFESLGTKLYERTEYVAPTDWHNEMCKETSKDLKPKVRSKEAFISLWGDRLLKTYTNPQREGIIDAALIAEYGRTL